MRILITGSRDWDDLETIEDAFITNAVDLARKAGLETVLYEEPAVQPF